MRDNIVHYIYIMQILAMCELQCGVLIIALRTPLIPVEIASNPVALQISFASPA